MSAITFNTSLTVGSQLIQTVERHGAVAARQAALISPAIELLQERFLIEKLHDVCNVSFVAFLTKFKKYIFYKI